MKEVLVPEEVLAKLDPEIRQLAVSTDDDFTIDPEDELYGAAFLRWLLFERWPTVLEGVGVRLTPQRIAYNLYYWALKFEKLHERKHGRDRSIEQGVFQILERIDCEVDWDIFQSITDLVESEVAEEATRD